MPDDETIVMNTRTALAEDRRVAHPEEIAVSCKAGWVALRGTVSTPRQRSLAEKIARAVPGAHHVEVELRVDLRDRWLDNEARGRALQSLIGEEHVPADRVDVAVADGWLTLKGEVKEQSESDAAFSAVAGVAGVGGITNEIKVVTAGLDG